MLRRTLRLTLWLAAALAVGGYIVLSIRMLFDAMPRGATEAAIMSQARRMAFGQTPYPEATAGSGVPLMPAFPALVAPFVGSLGTQLWQPRLIGFLATLVLAIVAAIVVVRETKSATLGVTSAGMLLMGQGLEWSTPAGGGPVSLLLLLVLLGGLVLRYTQGIVGAAIASVLFSLGCFTHPSGLWFALAALIHLAIIDPKRFWSYTIVLVALVCGGQMAMSVALGPWFNFQAWDASLRHVQFQPLGILHYVGVEVLGALGVLTLATVLSFALPTDPWRGTPAIWIWIGIAAFCAGLAATQSAVPPAYALRPAAVVLAILGPVSVQRITSHLSAWPGGTRGGAQAVVLTALVLQLVMLLAFTSPLMNPPV